MIANKINQCAAGTGIVASSQNPWFWFGNRYTTRVCPNSATENCSNKLLALPGDRIWLDKSMTAYNSGGSVTVYLRAKSLRFFAAIKTRVDLVEGLGPDYPESRIINAYPNQTRQFSRNSVSLAEWAQGVRFNFEYEEREINILATELCGVETAADCRALSFYCNPTIFYKRACKPIAGIRRSFLNAIGMPGFPGFGDFEADPGDNANIGCFFYYLRGLSGYDADPENPCTPLDPVCNCCQECEIDSTIINLTSN